MAPPMKRPTEEMGMNGILSSISSVLGAGSARILQNAVPYQLAPLPSSVMANPVISFFFTLSPIILIILGVAVFFAGKLAKFLGIVIAILGLFELLFPYLLKVV
jgi:hypothetical protein